MLAWIKSLLTLFSSSRKEIAESSPPTAWQPEWTEFLLAKVAFYRVLHAEDRLLFNQRVLLFLSTTAIEGGQLVVSDNDRLLVAASAIIPVWGFKQWHYFNLKTVYLLPAAFNENIEFGRPDSLITGMVGTGRMANKLVLSRPALYLGFENTQDKQNVGIHEFVHLIDMMDGECDGYPERLKAHSFSIPWFELVGEKIEAIHARKSNIRDYGATNRAEFFAVASEYFFERPKMLKKKHPHLFEKLEKFYQQDILQIEQDLQPKRNAPCPCGSAKKYKRCCLPTS
ncbi:zinc-dependent peptidase [Alteromonas sp. W364]|uniref:M90 family metallopeptidase n=1 Tax=Alteromonas sp. W364 TaxID=3075610 RepID=UPI0028838685|nr:zinc-dependent peptidase [Alteromonas sp. W364]MDT0628834.1 zinc-dependent peptidase [Alteromonas sp. W364]